MNIKDRGEEPIVNALGNGLVKVLKQNKKVRNFIYDCFDKIKVKVRNVNLFFIQCTLIEMKVKFAISKTRIYVINETKSLLDAISQMYSKISQISQSSQISQCFQISQISVLRFPSVYRFPDFKVFLDFLVFAGLRRNG